MTGDAAQPISLPFREAIDFYRQKLNLPTHRWTDIRHGQHTRAFVVAGATKAELLADFRRAIDKAISEGTTLESFRRDFDRIVATHGWAYKGARGWRTRTIYDTNLTTAWQAGRYQQMTAPGLLSRRPFWQYRHSHLSLKPRRQHLAWDKLVLRHDAEFWKTHYPPNGWGCKCRVETLSQRDLDRMGKSGPDPEPAIEWERRTIRASSGFEAIEVPAGIDTGWAYNVGEAAWGRPVAEEVMDAWAAAGEKGWEKMPAKAWDELGRPELIPVDRTAAKAGPPATDSASMIAAVETAIGGKEAFVTLPSGETVHVDAELLGGHLAPDRAPFLPLLMETLRDPFEVWAAFEKSRANGEVRLRFRLVKAVAFGPDRLMLSVVQLAKGQLEAWSFLPTNANYLRAQRRGLLLYGRDVAKGAEVES